MLNKYFVWRMTEEIELCLERNFSGKLDDFRFELLTEIFLAKFAFEMNFKKFLEQIQELNRFLMHFQLNLNIF